METNPADQSPADGAKEAFKAKFSSTWEEALELGMVHNAKSACEKLGTIDGDNLVPMSGKDINALWDKVDNVR